MKMHLLAAATLSLLLVSCGGGGGGTTDPTQTPTTPPTEMPTELTGDGTQTTIDNSINALPQNYSVPNLSDTDKQHYLDAINAARAISRDCNDGQGVVPAANPLSWSDALYAAGYEHNYDMINIPYFDHIGSGTLYDITGTLLGTASTTDERIANYGYFITLTSGSLVGENLALGYESIEEAIEGWIASPGHCANLMNATFSEMGLSKVKDPISYGYYWVHTLGYRQ